MKTLWNWICHSIAFRRPVPWRVAKYISRRKPNEEDIKWAEELTEKYGGWV